MSTNSDPKKSRLWLDGDGFRAATGTALTIGPEIFTGALTGFDAFGGIQAGFSINRDQQSTDLTIWNAKGPYRNKKDEPVTTIAIRCVDQSKASVLTVLQGGSITTTGTAPDEVHEWVAGDDEEFQLLLNAVDPGYGSVAYYAERCTLNTTPSEVINDDALFGWDFEIKVLAPTGGGKPLRRFTLDNPLAP